MLRITIAQLNLTVGDIEGNVARMVAAAQQAAREQSDLIVFSELALCGYYPGDMLDEPPFLHHRHEPRGHHSADEQREQCQQGQPQAQAPRHSAIHSGTGRSRARSQAGLKIVER